MQYKTDWHRRSWDSFIRKRLPELLAGTCSLTGYNIKVKPLSCDLDIGIAGGGGDIAVTFTEIPMPDERGVFIFEGNLVVLVPEAEDETLTNVQCGGEMAYEYLAARIGKAGENMLQDRAAVTAWLPLTEWIRGLFREKGQILDTTNGISIYTHLRRIRLRNAGDPAPPTQIGLTCPVETPEGPNIGRVLTISAGADVRDGRVVAIDREPPASLGVCASMIPFFEYSDSARLVMATNLMRQWMSPIEGETAVVRTGREPDDPEIWCGFNLLTAFVSLGRKTYEDGIVLSESAASRMQYDKPIEPGDKLSNRHGTKGVISRILADRDMPKLPDGTSVECVFSFIALHTRMNSGQLFEALYSKAVKQGKAAAEVPPFGAPSRKEIAEVLSTAGLAENGMEFLQLPDGEEPAFPSVVGWVYWGRTAYTTHRALRVRVKPSEDCMLQGVMEYYALRNAKAFSCIAEYNGILSVAAPEAADLKERIESGEEPVHEGDTPAFTKLAAALRAGGIKLRFHEGKLGCTFIEDEGLALAKPIPHPWRPSTLMTRLPENSDSPDYRQIEKLNQRLKGLLESDAPESLAASTQETLAQRLREYAVSLLQNRDLTPRGRVVFSGKSVIVPSQELRFGQVGIPEEMAWGLFGPFAVRGVGKRGVEARSPEARKALDEVMSEKWILLNRAPTTKETAIIAFRPVRVPHRAIELHPLACRWMNADFDGDQVAVILPATAKGQKDLSERLSVAAHLERDSDLLDALLPTHEALWGLAWLSLTEGGRRQIEAAAGTLPLQPDGVLTASSLSSALRSNLQQKGTQATLDVIERLFDLGIGAAAASGASLNPFMHIDLNGAVSGAAIPRREAVEFFESNTSYSDPLYGPQLLAAKSGARGKIENLILLTHSHHEGLEDASGKKRTIERGRLQGLRFEDFQLLALTGRDYLAELAAELYSIVKEYNKVEMPRGYNLLARAARAEEPGVVFASAAANGEIDPLTDIEAKLFMGLT
jgi:hypothetical protein